VPQELVEQHRVYRVLAYHGRFDGSEPSFVGGSEGVVAADRVVAIVAVGATDEHAESVIAIRSAGIVVVH
jgi:hypothetical protein